MASTRIPATSREVAYLRRRVDALDAEVARLRQQVHANGSKSDEPWWLALAGKYDDDSVFADVVAEGRKWRQSQRPRKRTGRAHS